MGFDRPGDTDLPRDARQAEVGDVRAEPRGRAQYYADQQATVSAWDESAVRFRGLWAEYQRRWPAEERPPVDRSGDPPGSWRGEGNRFLDRPVNEEVDAACAQVTTREQDRFSPALREVEGRDHNRHLVGFEDRLKGRDRIKEKIADAIRLWDRSPNEAISSVPDAIRYTFQYREAGYTKGVRADIQQMKAHGFELVKLKNSWVDEQYKGINSQWIDRETGQRFELQFHTRISFEAKQLTHGSYERLRSGQTDEFEEMVLEAFQRKVCAAVPVPPGATEISDYPESGRDAGQGHLLRRHQRLQ